MKMKDMNEQDTAATNGTKRINNMQLLDWSLAVETKK